MPWIWLMNNVVHSLIIKPGKLFRKKKKTVYLIMIEMSVTHSQQIVGVMWVSGMTCFRKLQCIVDIVWDEHVYQYDLYPLLGQLYFIDGSTFMKNHKIISNSNNLWEIKIILSYNLKSIQWEYIYIVTSMQNNWKDN